MKTWAEHKLVIESSLLETIKAIRLFTPEPTDKDKQKDWFKHYMLCEHLLEHTYKLVCCEHTEDENFKEWSHLADRYSRALRRYDFKKINAGMMGDHWYRYETIYKKEKHHE